MLKVIFLWQMLFAMLNPSIVGMATLTGATDVALGTGAAGVFTSSSSLWKQLHKVV